MFYQGEDALTVIDSSVAPSPGGPPTRTVGRARPQPWRTPTRTVGRAQPYPVRPPSCGPSQGCGWQGGAGGVEPSGQPRGAQRTQGSTEGLLCGVAHVPGCGSALFAVSSGCVLTRKMIVLHLRARGGGAVLLRRQKFS